MTTASQAPTNPTKALGRQAELPAGGDDEFVTVCPAENAGSDENLCSAKKLETDAEACVENRVEAQKAWNTNVLDARDSLGSRASVTETDAPALPSDAADEAQACDDGQTGATEPKAKVDAGDPEAVDEGVPVDYSTYDVPGADASDDVKPFEFDSPPEEISEAVAFFEKEKAAETPAQKERARTTKSYVFTVMQYHRHPETNEVMLTQKQIVDGLEALEKLFGGHWRYCWVAHPRDRQVRVDEGTGEAVCCGLKGLHWHLVIWVLVGADGADTRPTIRVVSDILTVPSARVQVPKEAAAQLGITGHKGRNAAEKAFYDFAEYLPHESRRADAIQGVTQPERSYLVDDKQDGKPGKYQYGRGRVVANFDFSRDLDVHMAGRHSAAPVVGSLTHRKRKLRRLVGDGSLTLPEAKAADEDAYWDDLPRLKAVREDYEIERAAALAQGLGDSWHKSTMVICGPKGAGKGILADEVAVQTNALVAMAGEPTWAYAEPPSRNALEAVVLEQIVHHDDARYEMVPNYQEMLLYTDPHRVNEAYQRHTRTKRIVAPRIIMMSTSETPQSLALTMKARKKSDDMVVAAQMGKRYPPVDVDELLRRLGWVVEVALPDSVTLTGDDHQDYPVLRTEMLVSIRRVRVNGDRRIEPVASRTGGFMGDITTTHSMEPVAVVKGVQDAARFLAVSMLMENNQDVVERIPEAEFANYLAEKAAVEVAHAEQREREVQGARAAAEKAEREAAAKKQRDLEKELAELEEMKRLRSICTCSTYPAGSWSRHDDDCPLLPEDERERIAANRERELEAKAAKLRNDKFVLTGGTA